MDTPKPGPQRPIVRVKPLGYQPNKAEAEPRRVVAGCAHPGDKTQTRPREMVEILHRVESYTGSPPLVAHAWFRSEALPGFAGLTPDQLVRQGKANLVHAHLDRIMAGGYS